MNDSAIYLIDFYKVGHIAQYPAGTRQVWVNWTPRGSRIKGVDKVIAFGGQYFYKAILQEEFKKFFATPLAEVLSDYRALIKATLGVEDPRTDHIEALHRFGYLPIVIYSVPEGESVPLRVPMMVMTNTHPAFFWLPNYLETIFSNILWKPSTSATIAREYRKLFVKWALESGETDLSFVDWQGHDFSFRGMSGREDAILSGMGHLLSFSGTDTIPAIIAAHKYYNAPLSCGGSVPATEHSVMCAGGKAGELETFRRLIQDIYPKGIVSIVSDTWDLWKVLTEYVPALKDVILAREGKLVIRPDSGDPVNILCGVKSPVGLEPWLPAQQGVLRLLAQALGHSGMRDKALPLINKAATIYGDSITLERAEAILSRTVNELRLSPYNIILGIGSFTYEYQTRDVFGFAMKATAVRGSNDVVRPIYKKPVTDNGEKFSLSGIPLVNYDGEEELLVTTTFDPNDLDKCTGFQKVFEDGELLIEEDFETIRRRVRA